MVLPGMRPRRIHGVGRGRLRLRGGGRRRVLGVGGAEAEREQGGGQGFEQEFRDMMVSSWSSVGLWTEMENPLQIPCTEVTPAKFEVVAAGDLRRGNSYRRGRAIYVILTPHESLALVIRGALCAFLVASSRRVRAADPAFPRNSASAMSPHRSITPCASRSTRTTRASRARSASTCASAARRPVLWLDATGLDIDSARIEQGEKTVAVRVVPGGEDFVGLRGHRGEPFAAGEAVALIRFRGAVDPLATRGLFREQEAGKLVRALAVRGDLMRAARSRASTSRSGRCRGRSRSTRRGSERVVSNTRRGERGGRAGSRRLEAPRVRRDEAAARVPRRARRRPVRHRRRRHGGLDRRRRFAT